LLLLAAVLQHCSVETKHVLMGERGTLLLQLLYHVLLENERRASTAPGRGGPCEQLFFASEEEGDGTNRGMLLEVDVPRAVLLVLHSLVYNVPEGLLEKPEGAYLVKTSLGEEDG
jgi:hypothetical protein